MIIEQTKQHHDEGSKPIVVVAQCLKIAKKVSFHIASEASYVYILNGQKFICQLLRVEQTRISRSEIRVRLHERSE